MTTFASVTPEIARDRYGRPMIVPPDGGKPVAYTRTTTYIDCLEDKYGLQKWMMRMVATGLASRPDLLLGVSAHRDDKSELDRLCEAAKEAAAASAAATTGTALHALTEIVDRGETLPVLPEQARADIAAYSAATADLKPILIEQFCVLDPLRIGGTPDRVVEYEGTRYIADLKTGSIEYGALKIAMQLAIYARASTYQPDGTRGHHGADLSRALIVHAPAGQGVCTLHWVDIAAGWEAVKVATQVRDKRAIKFSDLTQPFDSTPALIPQKPEWRGVGTTSNPPTVDQLARMIAGCATADDVRALYAANEASWTDALTEAAKAHITQLPAAS